MAEHAATGSEATGARRAAWPHYLLIALVFLLLYGRYLIGFAPSGGDIVNQYLPYQQLIREAVRSGEMPYWNAQTFCGRPLLADIQNGFFYPPNWLHWLLPLPVSFALALALHGAWMLVGCWRLGRHWRLDPAATLLGAVLFCAGPFFTLRLSQGVVLFVYAGAWWPWLALAAARLGERQTFARLAALAATLALALLSGAPQIAYYGWLLAFAIAAALPAAAGEPARWLRRIAWIGAAYALALGLAAIQILPTYEFVRHSFERGTGASWEYITDGSLAVRLLWLLVNPGFLGVGQMQDEYYWGKPPDFAEGCFYLPAWAPLIMLPLAIYFFVPGRRGAAEPTKEATPVDQVHRRLAWLALAGVIFGPLLALGQYSPLFKVFFEWFPGFDRFRVPARLMIFYTTGLSMLTALVMQRMLSAQSARRGRQALIGILTIIGIVGLVVLLVVPTIRADVWRATDIPFYQAPAAVRDEGLRLINANFNAHGALALASLVLTAAGLIFIARRARPAGAHGERQDATRLAAAGVIVLCALGELVYMGRMQRVDAFVTKYNDNYYANTPLVELVRRENVGGGRVLWLDDVIGWQFDQNQPEIYPNRFVMHHVVDARGYDPVNARWIGQWMNLLAGLPPEQNPRGFMFVPQIARPAWLTLMGVELVLSYQDLTGLPGLRETGGVDFPEGRLHVYRNDNYRGLAFAAPRPRLARDRVEALFGGAQLADAPDAKPEEAIISDMPTPQLAARVDARFQVRPLAESAGSLGYAVDYPEPALLCLAQSAWPGWSVKLDGEYAPLATYNGTFMNVVVPPGKHEVLFEYIPPGFIAGRWISLVALVMMGYGLMRERMTSKSRE